MIIPAVTNLVIQCSKCGELQFRAPSLFNFSHFNKESYFCNCGGLLLTITHFNKQIFNIEYPCIYCGKHHFMATKRNVLWSDNILRLRCSDKKLAIGYIGPKSLIDNCCQEIKKNFLRFACQLVNDKEKEFEFEVFFVVYAVMEKLSKMVDQGKLGCRCGNKNLAVEILADRIELACERCNALGVIQTDRKDILYILDNLGSICLEENMTLKISDTYEKWYIH